MSKALLPYIAMVDFLADFLGENAEVVLHDLSDLEHSIIKIRNSGISGRKNGDPATDWVIRHLQQQTSRDYHCNYRGRSKDGKALKCASIFIRDDKDAIVGVLCVNLQVDEYLRMQSFLDSFLATEGNRNHSVKENMGQSVEEMIHTSIQKAFLRHDCKPSRLSQSEKMLIIEQINADGVFQLKGAVGTVAKKLRISEPTVYRYLSRLNKK